MAAASDPKSDAPHRASWTGILIALAIGLVIVVRVLAVFWAAILLAAVAAGLLAPWYQRLVRRLNGRAQLAAGVICILLVVALLLPLIWTGREVSREALAFYELSTSQLAEGSLLRAIEQQQPLLERANQLLEPFNVSVTPQDIYNQVATLGVRLGGFFYKQGLSMAKGLVRFVLSFLIWVIIVYYLLVDGDRLRGWFYEAIPLPADQQDLLRLRFMDMSSSLVVGNGVAATIQALVGGFVFAVLGLPGPVLWAVVMWILGFIPIIGISSVYIPLWVILMVAGQTGTAFAMLIPLMIVATVSESILKPMMVGHRARLHTALVFLSLLGGLDAFGAVGLVLGPLVMTAFLTLAGIYQEQYRPYITTSRSRRARSAAQRVEAPPDPEAPVRESSGGAVP